MVRLRASKLSDLSIVASWIESASTCRLWCGTRVSYPIDRASLPEAIEFGISDSWTATSSRAVVAFGQLVPKPGGRLHLARLITAPEDRRAGLGRLVTSHLLETARARNPSAISLNVSSENETALHLYKSLGFSAANRPQDEADSPSMYMEFSA
ncbi:MAG: N-acetyltransferase [Myxococcota bacterium]|nr:N-acetyltransferase [Myxococcota bacterium]